jgi:uncharacterized membrane protein
MRTLLALLLMTFPAFADFKVCNKTTSRVGLSVGYKEGEIWVTEGWWNLLPNACETILRGTLVAKYYYIYGIDYDKGGEWGGRAFMCSRDKEYSIKGIEDCLTRGYDRTGFMEIDTQEQKDWTVQLDDSSARPQTMMPKSK